MKVDSDKLWKVLVTAILALNLIVDNAQNESIIRAGEITYKIAQVQDLMIDSIGKLVTILEEKDNARCK